MHRVHGYLIYHIIYHIIHMMDMWIQISDFRFRIHLQGTVYLLERDTPGRRMISDDRITPRTCNLRQQITLQILFILSKGACD